MLLLDDQTAIILWYRLPLIGEQFIEAINRVAHDTTQHVI